MGETRTVRTARLVAAVTAGLAATALLASCSSLRAAPGEAVPSAIGSSAAAPSASAAPSSSAPVPATTAPSATPVVATPSAVVTTPGKAAVVPFVTSATWDAKRAVIDVSAIVPKILESSGTCTATAVKGDVSVEQRGDSAAASSYTGCSQLAIGGSELSPGTWSVTVSYSSDDSAGTSAARTVTVG